MFVMKLRHSTSYVEEKIAASVQKWHVWKVHGRAQEKSYKEIFEIFKSIWKG
jgi:hypothetical protein